LVAAGDPSSTRLVYSMVIGLLVVGLVLVLLGIWLVRQTRADLEVLAPLERMGDGDWKKRDRSTQRRLLDEVRPAGAEPLTPSTQPPSIDDEFEQQDHPVTSFSDLGPGVVAERGDPLPIEHVAADVEAEQVDDADAAVESGVEEVDATETVDGGADTTDDEADPDDDESQHDDEPPADGGQPEDDDEVVADEAMSDPRP
jgi:hypothetical protein